MMNIYQKTILATAIPLIGIGTVLTITPAAAEECSNSCTTTDTATPEHLFRDTTAGALDWEIENNANGQVFGIGLEGGANGKFQIENGAADGTLVVDDSSRVGINTTAPGVDLEVQSTLPEIRLDDDSAGGLQMDIGVNQTFMHIEGNGGQDIVHIDANAPSNSIYIQPSGDVGIGTSSPDFAMHVRRSNGTAQVKITEDQVTTAVKTLFSLVCTTCTPGFRFANNGTGQIWFFRMLQNGNFSVDDPNTAAKEATFLSGGNMEIGGILTQGSSRTIKHDIEAVDPMDILARVDALEIAEWTYNHQAGVRHMGPMAEDFYAAFELGHTKKGLSAGDASGVALAAIQALNSKLDRNEQSLAEKDSEIAELQQRLTGMEALSTRLDRTEQSLAVKENNISELQQRLADMEAQMAQVQELKEMLVNSINQNSSPSFTHVSY
jgi:uncharacterized coiled-coil protein SlyX